MIDSKWFIQNKEFIKVCIEKVKDMYEVAIYKGAFGDKYREVYYSSASLTFAAQVFVSI